MAPRRALAALLLGAALAAASAPAAAARAQPPIAPQPLQAFVSALTAPQTKAFRAALVQHKNTSLSSWLAPGRSSVQLEIDMNLLCGAVK